MGDEQKEKGHHGHHDESEPKRFPVADACSTYLSRAESLPHKGSGGDAHTGPGHEGERFN